jgi:hypothetical protein
VSDATLWTAVNAIGAFAAAVAAAVSAIAAWKAVTRTREAMEVSATLVLRIVRHLGCPVRLWSPSPHFPRHRIFPQHSQAADFLDSRSTMRRDSSVFGVSARRRRYAASAARRAG